MSNYKANIERIARERDDISYRETGKPCQYVKHSGDREAVLFVDVDVSECCKTEKNEHVRVCWSCGIQGYHDKWDCRCEGENARHKATDLTFKGELQALQNA